MFIFIDDEDSKLIIKWDRDIFQTEYVKLQKKYREKNLGYSDFYETLENNLKKYGIKIYAVPVLYHNNFIY